MRPRLSPLLLLLACLAGCGGDPSRVILYVYGEYEIPNEIDSIELAIGDPDSGDDVADFEIELTDDDALPLRILLEPNAEHPKILQAYFLARKGEVAVAHLTFSFTWEEGRELIANQNEQLALQSL